MLKQFLLEWVVKQRLKKTQVSEDYKVEAYLELIPKYFDAGKAEDKKLTVVYEIHDSGENDGAWTVQIANGKCSLSKGAVDEYDTLLYMTADSYRRILSGRLDFARLAYSTGAVRFFGNTLGHRELNEYLTIPKGAGVAAL
jgi:alkyl sulfatase BDS1-like metallo-beta-lactamase superfamily hydrolase